MSGREQQSRFELLIATDAGYDPIVRAAMAARATDALVLFGAEAEFPFRPRPSTILVPHMPAGVIACVPALEEFGVASRLASTAGLPGCFDGSVVELARLWLQSLDTGVAEQVRITVSGAEATVTAVMQLGRSLDLPVATLPV